jgi:hypothetical protein
MDAHTILPVVEVFIRDAAQSIESWVRARINVSDFNAELHMPVEEIEGAIALERSLRENAEREAREQAELADRARIEAEARKLAEGALNRVTGETVSLSPADSTAQRAEIAQDAPTAQDAPAAQTEAENATGVNSAQEAVPSDAPADAQARADANDKGDAAKRTRGSRSR